MSNNREIPDVTGTPTVPDYPLAETLVVDTSAQMKAIADPTRTSIAELLLERAATTSELAEALHRPKGTIDHHLKVLANAGLVHVVRTRKVRAMTERYWGRTARTFQFDSASSEMPAALWFLEQARDDIERSIQTRSLDVVLTTLRRARIPADRVAEFNERLLDLAVEFVSSARGGDTVYSLLIALYPTDRPVLPAPKEGGQ